MKPLKKFTPWLGWACAAVLGLGWVLERNRGGAPWSEKSDSAASISGPGHFAGGFQASGAGGSGSFRTPPADTPRDGSMSTADLLRELKAYPIEAGYSPEYKRMVVELIERDPKLALLELFDERSLPYQPGFEELAQKFAKTDPSFLIHWLTTSLPQMEVEKDRKDSIRSAAITAFARIDPGNAFTILKSLSLPEDSETLVLRGIFAQLGRADFPAALQRMASLPESQQAAIKATLAVIIGNADPRQALELLESIPANPEQISSRAWILKRWLENDPVGAGAHLETLTSSDFEAFARAEFGTELIQRLAAQKPEHLERFLEKMVPSLANSDLFRQSINQLAEKDFTRALNVVDGMPDSPFRQELCEQTFTQAVRNGKGAEAIEALQGLDAQTRQNALSGMGGALAEQRLDTILSTSEQLDAADRSKVLGRALAEVRDPEDFAAVSANLAAGSYSAQLEPEDLKELTDTIGARLTHTDAEQAIQWMEQLPNDVRSDAVAAVSKELASSNPQRLAEWLNQSPPNDDWAIAAATLVRALEITDTETAKIWSDELQRYRADRRR